MGERDTVPQRNAPKNRAGTKTAGQVSIEYMLIIGFMLAVLVPLLVLYNDTQRSTQASLAEGQVLRFANTIRDAAERVYYAGPPAQETLLLTLPEGVVSATFDNTTILYTVYGVNGPYDIAVDGLAPLTGTLPTRQGRHRVIVLAEGDVVNVTTS